MIRGHGGALPAALPDLDRLVPCPRRGPSLTASRSPATPHADCLALPDRRTPRGYGTMRPTESVLRRFPIMNANGKHLLVAVLLAAAAVLAGCSSGNDASTTANH